MGAGYQVILSDLDAAAHAFATESTDFAKLRARMSPPPVDGGDDTVNSGIAAVLSTSGRGQRGAVRGDGRALEAAQGLPRRLQVR